jgi:cystathionine beta-synthase
VSQLSSNPPENIVSRVSELIGHTPLFELCSTETGTRLLLKLEQFNPTGSAKVRMAEQMIVHAELTGELRPNGRIIEPTSGNTGLGLALVAIERGYRLTTVVDEHASKDKLRAMAAMGAELVYVSGSGSGAPRTAERKKLANEMAAADEEAYRPDQHNNPGNWEGYRALARELLADISGDLDYLISSVGTGGSLCGTTDELRRMGSGVVTVGVEPAGSIIFGEPGGKYWQTGGGNPEGFPIGNNVDLSLIDEGTQVTDVDAFATARVIARNTGLMIGGTAGGAVSVALKRLDELPPGSTVVTLICDAGEKYLDTVFDDDWMRERDLLDPVADQEAQQLLEKYGRSVRPDGPAKPTSTDIAKTGSFG